MPVIKSRMPKRKSAEGIDKGSKKPKVEETAKSEDKAYDTTINTKTKDGRDSNLKICSWNIAGLRAWLKKDGLGYISREDADIVCLQETKCTAKEIPGEVTKIDKKTKSLIPKENGYFMYWNEAEQKGYSGVSLWSKIKPIKVTNGMGVEEHDKEGRMITAEFEKYFVVTSYVPNSGKKLVRLDYRRTWNADLKKYLNTLDEKKPVIYCGDLNVAHKEIDIANPKGNKRNAGFTDEERQDMTELLEAGYIDSFRLFCPDKENMYSFWTYMANARAKNVGWRLDYFLVSKSIEENLCDSVIRTNVYGSDHCPVVLTLCT